MPLLKKDPKTKKREQAIEAYRGRGQPSAFRPEFSNEVERLCRLGVRDIDIALFFNVALTTVKNWEKQHPEFFVAMLRGKQQADMNVAEALYQNAINGDTTAQIFWLKNRRPDLWRDVTKAIEEDVSKESRTYTGAEVLAALKESGHVLLEGEYEIIDDVEERDGKIVARRLACTPVTKTHASKIKDHFSVDTTTRNIQENPKTMKNERD
jgi:hypothetical protein